MVIIGSIMVFSLITLLFVVLKKPIGIIIFNIFIFIAFYMMVWDLNDHGVLKRSLNHWSISYYLYFIAIIVVLAGAIWMLVSKIKMKKQRL